MVVYYYIYRFMEKSKKLLILVLGLGGVLFLVLLAYLFYGRQMIISPLPDDSIRVIFVKPTATPK